MSSLILRADIYSEKSIEQTIQTYKGYANITVERMHDGFQLSFHECRFDEELTIKEFENYLIGIENT